MAVKRQPAAKSAIDGRRKAALHEGTANYKARRDEVIRKAAQVFREQGYEATTLGDIARALGTDRASLYYYVGSKEEALQEIVRDVLRDDVRAAEEVKKSSASAPEKVRNLIKGLVVSFVENYPHVSVYIEDMGRIARQDSEWATDVVQRTRRYESLVISILEKGRNDRELRSDFPVELQALALFGMINWMHRWYRPGSKFDPEQIAETFSALVLDGISTS
jgi:TetR/AcrR family transcriptional regulator, cholesterol catabolism regulator